MLKQAKKYISKWLLRSLGAFPKCAQVFARGETKPEVGGAAAPDMALATDLPGLDEKIRSMMEYSENLVSGKRGNTRMRVCKVCGKEGSLTQTKQHLEAKHIGGLSFTCNICGNVAKTRNSLAVHKSVHHRS